MYQNLHLHRAILRHREVTARNPNIPVCRVHTLCTPPSFRLPSARRNLPICFVDGAFSLHSTNGRKLKSRQKALLPRPSDGYRVQNKNASIVSILTFLYGGEGGIRTLEPLLTVTRFPIVRARPGYATSPRSAGRFKIFCRTQLVHYNLVHACCQVQTAKI